MVVFTIVLTIHEVCAFIVNCCVDPLRNEMVHIKGFILNPTTVLFFFFSFFCKINSGSLIIKVVADYVSVIQLTFSSKNKTPY